MRPYDRRPLLFVALLLVLGLLQPAHAAQPSMRAHFINVGQADAILLEFPCANVLIDAGDPMGADDRSGELVAYLRGCLEDSFGPKMTLDYIIITHDHSDHQENVPEVLSGLAPGLTVRNFIHSGLKSALGLEALHAVEGYVNPDNSRARVRLVTSEEIMDASGPRVLTDDDIDPIGDDCTTCDPRISILSGEFTKCPPSLTPAEFTQLKKTENNESIVVRVDLAKFSLLLTGDLQKPAIEALTDYYVDQFPREPNDDDATMLDVDLYKVGHHGSDNATTDDLVDAMSPAVAVVSVGRYDEYPTDGYHHPAWSTIEMLLAKIAGKRSPIEEMVAFRDGRVAFKPTTIDKKVYATAWDGNIEVTGRADGSFSVHRNH